MPGGRLELPWTFKGPTDFKSVASTNSAIPAKYSFQLFFWRPGGDLHSCARFCRPLPSYSVTRPKKRVSGIEPPSLPWQGSVITTILHPLKWCRDPDLHWGHQVFQTCALLPELSRLIKWWTMQDSNLRPSGCKPDALNQLS